MPEIGKPLIVIGIVLVLLGLALSLGGRASLFHFGRLPGDLVYRRGNFTFYFPLVTSILISIILTLVFWFLGRR